MTDYREMAIKDVVDAITFNGQREISLAISYAVAQCEARLRLEDALRCFLEDPRFTVTVGGNPNAVVKMVTEACAALAAVKPEASVEFTTGPHREQEK